ncbi:MAG: hypothetical protein DMG96_33815 [Acidobacteria bacterium]|nr:MAG: hypothetical protein DMG96_33815 [Acidobacteriota bacterium]
MPCILKALIAWIILLVVSGAIGLFLRQALFGLLVPFPAPSTHPAVEQALRSTHRSFKRAHVANTVFCFLVTAAYLWAVFHFWNILLAAAAFLIMIVVVEHYAQTPRWVRFTADAILWGPSVLVWYSLCKKT